MSYLSVDQRLKRLQAWLNEYELWTVRAVVPLSDWTLDGAPHALGAPWPSLAGMVSFVHPEIAVPDDWPRDETRLELDLGGEGLVTVVGPDGSTHQYGLDPNHTLFPVPAGALSVSAECVARLPQGVPNRDARLATARLVRLEPQLIDLVGTVRQALELARALAGYATDPIPHENYHPYRKHPDHSRPHEVVEPMLSVLEKALRHLRWPTGTSAYVGRIAMSARSLEVWQLPEGLAENPAPLDDDARKSVGEALVLLRTGLRALQARYPQTGSVAVSGHAHIDLAWLWPIAETRNKLRRSFSSVVELMDRYPEYRFNQSTAQYYAWLEQDDPALLARITDKVAKGQWEPIGAMWVEPDVNMPTGESLVRQLLYGTRKFDALFGENARTTVNWLPDTFGFSPVLPQLLRLAGIEGVFTHKTNWSEKNKMETDLFWFEGLDGSRVLMHTFDNPGGGYNGLLGARATMETWRNYGDKEQVPETLLTYGHGDGGGGPDITMLEAYRQIADLPVMPSVRQVNISDWYKSLPGRLEHGKDFPVWSGELYLQYHRGTLTTQGRTKYLHRRAERALITAEVLGGLAHLIGAEAPKSLEAAWQTVLRNEFHDILPGSSIHEVYDQAEAELQQAIDAAREQARAELDKLAAKAATDGAPTGILAVNPDLSARPLRLISAQPLPGGQQVEDGYVLAGTAEVPPLSAASFAASELNPASGLSVAPDTIENDFVRVEIGSDGTLSRVFDKRAGRECLADRGNQIWAYADRPRDFDAWDIEQDYALSGQEVLATAPAEIVETGPHRAALRISRKFANSTIIQTMRLWSNSPRIEIKTDLDWHDRKILLKARFPLAVRAPTADFECAFGVIPRPTIRNNSFEQAQYEVAAHRFADLSEPGFGVALLNDGKYGHHAVGNELGITLLRSPVYPDLLADEGTQSFTYALLPHAGGWLEGGVLAEAEDLNQPMPVLPIGVAHGNCLSPIGLEGATLGLGGLKPAEDGNGLILRTYEPAGGRGTTALHLPEGWTLGEEVNLLEEPLGDAETGFGPFQVHSWRLVRTD